MQAEAAKFTIGELDVLIPASEAAFRMYMRAAKAAFWENDQEGCTQHHLDAAQTAAILVELRHQRKILEN